MGTAPWMGEAALHGCCKPRRGGSEGPRAPRRQLGYFFFFGLSPAPKQPSPAPAGLQLFAGCSCHVAAEGGELRLPWPGRVLSQTPQQGIGVRKVQGTSTSPYSSAGCSPPRSPPHRCPAGLHGPVLLPTPYNGRVWPRGLLRAIFGVRRLAGCPGAGPLVQRTRHEGSRQGEPKGAPFVVLHKERELRSYQRRWEERGGRPPGRRCGGRPPAAASRCRPSSTRWTPWGRRRPRSRRRRPGR